MTQITLFPEYDINIETKADFKKAIENGTIDNLCLLSLSRIAYQRGKLQRPIISVNELTIIPAWRSMCDSTSISQIESEITNNLYMQVRNNTVCNVTNEIHTILNGQDIAELYRIWKNN